MKKLLIVVDMLNDFVHENGSLQFPQAREISNNVKVIVDGYRETDNPIIFLKDEHDRYDDEFLRFPPHAIRGTWGCEIIDELKEGMRNCGLVGDIIIPKTRYSGFYKTSLDYFLEELNPIDEVKVVGVCTSICVMATVGGLANRGYNIVVPKVAVADFDNVMHSFSIRLMEKIYGAKIV